ncbi:hypothetical protein D3C71_1772400 [compost metagenome]
MLLEFARQVFVGAQIRYIRRQKEQFDPLLAFFQRATHVLAMVHAQVVEILEHFARWRITHEPAEEADQHVGDQRFPI